MATLKPELKAILDECGIDPRDKSQIWDCHGTLVLYHKAYEIIAAKRNITFDPPTIIEASSESKIVAILVIGRWNDRVEWSIGEAAPGNNKNAYPYAMAEKRAKDRVVAKLVGLAAYVYSEDEADEFKSGERKAVESDPTPRASSPTPKASPSPAPAAKAPASRPAPPKKFDLLRENGERLAEVDSPELWCQDLRRELEAPGAMVAALWKMNEPLAAVIRDHFPDVQWADRKGTKYPAYDFLAAIVRKLTPGIAA